VLRDIESLDALEAFLRRKAADISTQLTGYQLVLPVGLRDFSQVSDHSFILGWSFPWVDIWMATYTSPPFNLLHIGCCS